MPDTDKVRLDKWLWAARFYKTRGLASEAIAGGHVHVNGVRAKAARLLDVGDRVELRKGPYTFALTVRALSGQRGPASVAQQLYEEDADSHRAREAIREQQRLHASPPAPPSRPDKRSRRKIIRFNRSHS